METCEIEEKTSTSMIAKKKSKKKNNKTKVNQNINNKMLDMDVISQNLEERLHIKKNGIIIQNGERNSKEQEIVESNLLRANNNNNNISNNKNEDNFTRNTQEENGLDKISLKNQIEIDENLRINEDVKLEIESNKDVNDKSNGCSNKNGCEDINEKHNLPVNVTTTTKSETQTILQATTTLSSTSSSPSSSSTTTTSSPTIEYKEYESELQMPDIMRLIQKDLSEPYSIYTYRYFIHNWPKLCFLAMNENICVGAIVCKLDMHRNVKRGYIAMLAVDKDFRKLKIGSNLVQKAIQAMLNDNADEVVLETEITNIPALRLYENLGFVRDKRLFHYYLNGVDALRLKLWFR